MDSAELTVDASCDLPCPGDPTLFCGGFLSGDASRSKRHQLGRRISRRDAPPGILLTLYLFAEANQESSSEITAASTPSTSPDRTVVSQSNSGDISISPTLSNPARTSTAGPGDVSLSSTLNNPDQTSVPAVNSEDISLEPTLIGPDQTSASIGGPGDASLTDSPPSVPTTFLPGVNPPPLPSSPFNPGNLSRAATFEAIVTTVVYTVLDPHDPAYLTVAEFCTTLKYPPCRNCQFQRIPTVEMTTILTACDACGYHGESSIELTIPLGANPALMTSNPYTPEDGPDGSPAAVHDENSGPEYRPRPGGAEARPTVVPVGKPPSKANGYGGHDRPVIHHDETTGEHNKENNPPGGNHTPVGEPGPSQHEQVPSNDHGEPAGPGYEPQIGPGKDGAIVRPTSALSVEAVPKPEPAGASADLKVFTVPMANIPSTPPDSPVIVAAGHVARGVDGVLTFFALVAGLFLML